MYLKHLKTTRRKSIVCTTWLAKPRQLLLVKVILFADELKGPILKFN